MKRFLTALSFLFLCLLQTANGQSIFPVSMTVQSIPPHSGTLADWAVPGVNRLGANLLLLDAFENAYQVRLKITIEGNGISLGTSPGMLPPPITLRYGTPLQITGADLAPYLQVDNLIFSGITREQYLSAGSLPEGLYTVCVQAFDYDRSTEKAVSMPACTGIFYQRLDPPVVLIPNVTQAVSNPQNIGIQWQPRHGGGFPPSYTVQIFEFNPAGITPQQIIQANQAFVTKQINSVNSCFITPTDPLLVPGRSYIVRVRVTDPTNRHLFNNDGWSEPVVFQYGDPCPAPTGLRAENVTDNSAEIKWNPRIGFADNWTLRIRDLNGPAEQWYQYNSALPKINLTELSPQTQYVAQLRATCPDGSVGPFSDTIVFATTVADLEPVDCGQSFSLPEVTNHNNISLLKKGDVVMIGGFQCQIFEVQRSNRQTAAQAGAWQGFGQVYVPWLKIKLNCRFTDLYVNTDKVVYDGNIIANAESISAILDSMVIPVQPQQFPVTTDFCGNNLLPAPPSQSFYNPDIYNQINPNGSNFFIPYNALGSLPNNTQTYDRYNPFNTTRPYDPYNYNDPNNPYTPNNPYNPYSTWNPYNYLNPYDPNDYTDPANPYSAANPYNPGLISRMDSLYDLNMTPPTVFNTLGFNLPRFIGKAKYRIGLVNVRFTPRGAALDAYLRISPPQLSQPIVFKMTNMGFHPGGLLGESKLYLSEDLSYTVNNKMKMVLKGGLNTYASWDCNGFVGFSIEGKVVFCPDVLIPVNAQTGQPKMMDTIIYQNQQYQMHNYVSGSFRLTMTDWDEFTGKLNITPFTLPQLPGWVFTVQDAVFDFSETKTPADLSFPLPYTHPDLADRLAPALSPLWKGVTIKRLQINCPRKFPFAKGTATQQLVFGGTDMVFDERGVTGDFFAKNLLPLNEGRLSTWGASIDSVNISILVNQFRSFTVKGGLLPNPLDDTIGYSCMIQPGSKYLFSLRVVNNREYNVRALRSKFVLFPNTEATIIYNELTDQVSGQLLINGKAMFFPTVKANNAAPPANDNPNNNPPPENAKDVLRVPFIQVQGLQLATTAPYVLNAGLWQMGGDTTAPPKLSSFPITIKQVGMFANQQQKQVAFVLAAAVNLTSQTEQGLKAEGGIKIICDVELDPVTKKQSWRFNRVFLDSLMIDYSAPGYAVRGKVIMFENTPAYGSGFQGSLKATFKPRIGVDVAVMYGKMADYSYFFLDAYASFTPGLPLGSSGLAIYGFGGGAYYHMQRSVPVTSLAAPYGLSNLPTTPTSLGNTLDGAKYVPSKNILFGIKAKVGLGTIKQEIFNGDVVFEINFNNNGGVNQIGFRGSARFMTPPDVPGTPKKDPAVRADVDMIYSVPAETFHCTIDMFINVNGGAITGAYYGKRAGRGVIHYDPTEWYIQLGTPQQRIRLSYSLGELQNMLPKPQPPANPADTSLLSIDWSKLGIMLTAYFDAGTVLPPFPDLPPEVANALEFGNYNPMSSSTGNGGTGFMFGASLDFKMPEMGFWKFYARFDFGAGFDVMMRDYGENAYCAGSSPPLGVNGWYATGQLYAYMIGAVGIKVSFMGSTRKIPILEINAGAVLQAKLPNPYWAKGAVGGRYSVLGGLVKGKFRVEFETGKKCDIVGGSPLDGVEMIASTSPITGAADVDVFTRPQATFNLPLGQVFQLEQDGVITFYTALIDTFEVRNYQNNIVTGEVKWNVENDVVALTPEDILDGNKEFKLKVSLRFLKSPDGTSNWTPVMQNNHEYRERRLATFTTGAAPDYIPEQNVAYSYPVRNQANFLKNESPAGYVKLVQGQPYLFKNQPEFNMQPASDWQQKARFMQGATVKGESDLTYDRSNKMVSFPIPGGLPNDAVLHLSLANVPTTTSQAVDANVVTQIRTLASENTSDTSAGTALVRERVAQGNLTELQTKELYGVNLRTSIYNSFSAKINAMRTTEAWEAPLMFGGGSGLFISQFGVTLNGPEYFDQTDLNGRTESQYDVKPMVKMEANLGQTAQNWYNNGAMTHMYNILPNAQIPAPLGRPDTTIMGRVPHRNGAVRILYGYNIPTALNEQHISSGTYPLENNICRVSYRPQYYMKLDEWDFTTQIGDWYTAHGSIPQSWSEFLQWNLPGTPNGNYATKFKYYLPGQTTPNSVETIQAILDLEGN